MSAQTLAHKGIFQEEVLYDLLKKEQSYYKAILKLTHQENELLQTQENTRQLQLIIKKKKTLLSCIHDLDTALLPLRNQWMERKRPSDTLSDKINIQILSLTALIKEILDLDTINQALLKNQIGNLQEKLEADAYTPIHV